MTIASTFSHILVILCLIIIFRQICSSVRLCRFHLLQSFQDYCIFFINPFCLLFLYQEVKGPFLIRAPIGFDHLGVRHANCTTSKWVVREKVHCVCDAAEMTLGSTLVRSNIVVGHDYWNSRTFQHGHISLLGLGEATNIHLIWKNIVVDRTSEGLIGGSWLVNSRHFRDLFMLLESQSVMSTILVCPLASLIATIDWGYGMFWWRSLLELLVMSKTRWSHRSSSLEYMLSIWALKKCKPSVTILNVYVCFLPVSR